MTELLVVSDVSFSYGGSSIVSSFSLDVRPREVVCIMGPSGSGKSTLLRIIAGLEVPYAGALHFDKSHLKGGEGGIFLGFQDYDAFPWLTVSQNIDAMRRFRSGNVGDTASKVLRDVGLEGADRKYPSELSGGMRKRLSLARCLAGDAGLVLLDEPFSSLDVRSRNEMHFLVQRVILDTECGVVLVSHDVDEAVFLSTRILVCDGPPLVSRATLTIDLPQPRDNGVRTTPKFEEYVMKLRKLLDGEPSLVTQKY